MTQADKVGIKVKTMTNPSKTIVSKMLNRISAFINLGKADSLKRRLIKGAAGSFGLKIAGTGLTFLNSLLFARLLGTEGFGTYAYVIAWTNLLIIPATLGLPQLIVREIAIYQTQSEWGLMRGLISWSNQVVLIVSIILAMIAGGIAYSFGINGNSQMLLVFFIALISVPIISLTKVRLSVMRGLHKVVLAQLPEILITPLLLIILSVFAHLVLREEFKASTVVAMNILAIGITFITGVCLLHQTLPKVIRNAPPQYKGKKWINSSLPLMFLGAMHLINSRTDILMLGAIKGIEDVGVYVVVSRLTSLIVFILLAVNSALAPNIASLYAEGKVVKLQQIITKGSRIVFFVSLTVAVILIVFSYWILLLYGSDFTRGQNALIILSLGQLVNAAMGPVGLLLTMSGHEKYTAISVGTGAIFNVILNALLIPIWKIEGAAIATTSSIIIWNSISFIYVQKNLQINSTAIGNLK